MLVSLVTAAHVFVCVLLIAVVLLQQGKGADMGATFGGGSQTVFGASGADNLLTRVTTGLAFFFMASSIFLALNAQHKATDDGSLFENVPAAASAPAAESAPQETANEDATAAAPADESESAAPAPAAAEAAAPAEAPSSAEPASDAAPAQ